MDGLSIVPSPAAGFVETADWVPRPVVEGKVPAETGDPGEAEPEGPKSELIITGDDTPKVEAVSDEDSGFGLAIPEVAIDKGETPEGPKEPKEPPDEVAKDAKEELGEALTCDAKSELTVTVDETPRFASVREEDCGIELAIPEAEEPEET